jgi:hypothetical protein
MLIFAINRAKEWVSDMLKTGISEEQHQRFISDADAASKHLQAKEYGEALDASLKAMELGERILDMKAEHWEKVCDDDVQKLVGAYSVAASSYKERGDTKKVNYYAAKCIETCTTYAEYYESIEMLNVASTYYLKAWIYSVAYLGKNHITTARLRLCSGKVKLRRGRYSEAIIDVFAAYEIGQKLYGGTHLLTAEAKCLLKILRKQVI